MSKNTGVISIGVRTPIIRQGNNLQNIDKVICKLIKEFENE